MPIFNRMAAAVYATQYAFVYNPEWPSDKGLGGDCTNFVSQALYAGGWTMVPPFEDRTLARARNPQAWYSGKAGSSVNERSRTWAAAANFDLFLRMGNRAKRCQMSELSLGDVVQLKRSGIIYHTMIVTGMLPDSTKRRNIPFLTYHSNDVLRKPLTAIGASDDEIRCWKIFDSFADRKVLKGEWLRAD